MARYTSNFRTRTDQLDPVTPKNRYASDYDIAPAGEWKPAAWLPIVWTDTKSQDAFVISSGKVVAMDREGRIVPAGLRTRMVTVNLAYTSTDVDWGVIDLTTGEAVTAAVSYTPLQVAQALVERGLVLESDVASVTAANVFPQWISHPVGIMVGDVYVWAGDEPGAFTYHNYQKQHLVQFLRQAQLIVPHMASSNTTSDAFVAATLDGAGSTTHVAGAFIDAGEYWDITNIVLLNRYSYMDSDAPVVALGLAQQPVAKNTTRTPFECDVDGILVTEKTSADAISAEGDWFLDASVGVLFIHEDAWATAVSDAATLTLTYDYYGTATAGGDRYIHLDGAPKAGDYITVDVDSNLVPIAPTTVAHMLDVVGRVHKVVSQPKGLLDKVKTAWGFAGAPKEFKMPGTATDGFTDLITLTDETVADEVALIFIDIR